MRRAAGSCESPPCSAGARSSTPPASTGLVLRTSSTMRDCRSAAKDSGVYPSAAAADVLSPWPRASKAKTQQPRLARLRDGADVHACGERTCGRGLLLKEEAAGRRRLLTQLDAASPASEARQHPGAIPKPVHEDHADAVCYAREGSGRKRQGALQQRAQRGLCGSTLACGRRSIRCVPACSNGDSPGRLHGAPSHDAETHARLHVCGRGGCRATTSLETTTRLTTAATEKQRACVHGATHIDIHEFLRAQIFCVVRQPAARLRTTPPA